MIPCAVHKSQYMIKALGDTVNQISIMPSLRFCQIIFQNLPSFTFNARTVSLVPADSVKKQSPRRVL